MYDWKDLRKIRPQVFAETRAKMDEILAEGHKRLYVTCTIDEEFTPEGYIKAAVKGRLKRDARSPSELQEMKAQTPWKEEQRVQRRRMTKKIDRIRDLLYGIYEDQDIGRLGSYMPHFTLKVDHDIIDILEEIPEIVHVVPQRVFKPELYDAWHTVRVQTSWDYGYGGQGKAVAIIDTGVDRSHSMFTGRIIEEVCYSSGGHCPNNTSYQIGTGAARPRMDLTEEAYHGTHVAGIAAGDGLYRGMAWGAGIVAVNVFSKVGDHAGAYSADIVSGLNAVFNMRDRDISSVNLSLGYGGHKAHCDAFDPAVTSVIANMVSVGIAVVIAAGNADWGQQVDGVTKSEISWPACISHAVSVGAVTKTSHVVPYWSLSWNDPGQPHVSLYAPGYNITSAYPDEQYMVASGTSMAAPFVTGIIAILRSVEEGRDSFMDVETLIEKLQEYADWAYDNYNDAVSCPLKRLIQVDDFVFSEFEYKVAPPRLSPERGGYNRPFDVKIHSNRIGAKVRYTDNGLDPSPIYGYLITPEEKVRITKRTTLKAIAYSDTSEFLPSSVAEGLYDVWQNDDTSIGVPEDDSIASVSRAVRKSPGLLEYPDVRYVRVVDFSQGKMPINHRENARLPEEMERIVFNVKNSASLDPVFEQPIYDKLQEWRFPVDLVSDEDLGSVESIKYSLLLIRSPGMVYEQHPWLSAGKSFLDFGLNIVCMCAHTSFHDLKMSSLEGHVTPIGQERLSWARGDSNDSFYHPITKGLYSYNLTVNQFTKASQFQALFGLPTNCQVLFREGTNGTGLALLVTPSPKTNDPRYAHFGGHKDLNTQGWRLLRRTVNWAKLPADSRILGENLLPKLKVLDVGDRSTLCVSAKINNPVSSLKITPMLIEDGKIVGILEPKDVTTVGSMRTASPMTIRSQKLYGLSADGRSIDFAGNVGSIPNAMNAGKDSYGNFYGIMFRVPDTPIPPKSAILSARIVFEGRLSGGSEVAHARISCYAFGNCPPLDDNADANTPYTLRNAGRYYSPAGLWEDWLDIPDTIPDTIIYSPDIKKLVQFSVDSSDWVQGNALGFIIMDFNMDMYGSEYYDLGGPLTRSVPGAMRRFHNAYTKAPGPYLEVSWVEGEEVVFPTSIQKWDVAGARQIALSVTGYSIPNTLEAVMSPEINAWFI